MLSSVVIRRADAVINRRGGRPRDADRLELGDVLVARHRIAAGPARDHGLIDRQRQRGGRVLGVDGECEVKHG